MTETAGRHEQKIHAADEAMTMKKKQLYFNLAAQMVSFCVSFAISFFISPIIVREVGKEAHGFLGLANSFVGYVTIITVALNSLAGRFVTVCLHRKDEDSANRYFTSVFFANTLIVAVLLIPAIIFISFLERFFQVPPQILVDVKVTFALVFLGFFAQLMFSVFSVATFVTNKMYLASIRTIEANLLRLAVIVVTFFLLGPSVAFVSLGLFVYYSFIAATNVHYTKRLLPQIQIQKKYFDLSKIKELIISGCWSSISSLSNTLLEGLDLLISNLLLGAAAMGTLSIVKTIPNMIYQCMYSVLSVFNPQLTISYAKGDNQGVCDYLNYACKNAGCLIAMPVGFMIAFGDRFFHLWMPTEDGLQLWILTMLSMGELLFAGSVIVMHNLFTVTNHLKKPALVTLATGILSTIIVFTLLTTTDLGIYAIVAVSSALALLRHLLFSIPYSANCVGCKPKKFYWIAGRSMLFVGIAAGLGFLLKWLLAPADWLTLILSAGIMCVLTIGIVFIFFFSKEEKADLLTLFFKKKKRDA